MKIMNPISSQDIHEGVLNGVPETLDYLEQIVAVPAVNPAFGGTGELKRCETIERIIRSMGIFHSIERMDYPVKPGETQRPNLIARHVVDPSLPTAWILSHMDEVDPGEADAWITKDPRQLVLAYLDCENFVITAKDEVKSKIHELDKAKTLKNLYAIARSVDDNTKGGLCALMALKASQSLGLKLKYNVGIVWLSDEENGTSEFGLNYILNNSNPFKPEDLIIVPDSGNDSGTEIEVAEKARLVVKITAIGKQGHAAVKYEDSANALHLGSKFMVHLVDVLREKYNEVQGVFNPPISTFQWTQGSEGGKSVNAVPGTYYAKMDMRILPNYSLDDIIGFINKEAEIFAKNDHPEIKINVEVELNRPAPPPEDETTEAVSCLRKAIYLTIGKKADLIGIGGGTFANYIRQFLVKGKRLHAVVWNSSKETEHQTNEREPLEHFVRDTEVFLRVYTGIGY